MSSVIIPGSGYLPQSLALFKAMAAAGALPVADRRTIIDTAIDGMIDAGVWARFSRIHVPAAHAAAAALRDWKSPGTVLTANGGLTFTADRGYTGNGTDAYLGFGANVNALVAQNDCHIGAWQLNNIAEASAIVSHISGSGLFFIQARNGGNNFSTRCMDATSHTTAVATSAGHSLVSRDNSADYDKYRDGVSVATPVVASTGIPSTEMTVLRQITTYSTAEVAAVHCGASLTPTQVSDLYSILNTYLTAVIP